MYVTQSPEAKGSVLIGLEVRMCLKLPASSCATFQCAIQILRAVSCRSGSGHS